MIQAKRDETYFFESSRIDYFGTDWAIFRHMNRMGVHEEEPDRKFKNGEGGVRVTKTISGWDLGLSYLYTWEDLPYFVSFPEDGSDIQVTYKQSNILGFELKTTVGSYDQALDQLLRQIYDYRTIFSE